MPSTPTRKEPHALTPPKRCVEEGYGANLLRVLQPTSAYDTYWRFAAERQRVFHARLTGVPEPWTVDPILRQYRFTNAYRASDRVSQYLIQVVQYGSERPTTAREVVFRTLLFKVFNRIETWAMLENALGPIRWEGFDEDAAIAVLDRAMTKGRRVYSAAYIMPPVGGSAPGGAKHEGHIRLISRAMRDGLAEDVCRADSLEAVYRRLRAVPSFGPFLAFQFAVDLNYTAHLDHDENDFVVAGPGALDGIAKCFANSSAVDPAEIIEIMRRRQRVEFDRLRIDFPDLWGRPLHLIDCQNLFCEISKYARVQHPELVGASGRTRIKQAFRSRPDLLHVWYPPKWGINGRLPTVEAAADQDLFGPVSAWSAR